MQIKGFYSNSGIYMTIALRNAKGFCLWWAFNGPLGIFYAIQNIYLNSSPESHKESVTTSPPVVSPAFLGLIQKLFFASTSSF